MGDSDGRFVISERIDTERGTVIMFDTGAARIVRDNDTSEFIRADEAEAIADSFEEDS